MRLVTTLAVTALVLLVAITLTGCVSVPDLVRQLAKDDASACIAVHAGLYGDLVACRTNAPNAALIRASSGGMEIQHRGR